MLCEFQVLFRAPNSTNVHSLLVQAEDATDARERLTRLFPDGKAVIEVGPGRPLIEPLGYDMEETAWLLHCSERNLRDAQSAGLLPRAKEGRTLFPRWKLKQVIAARMGLEKESE